MISFITGASGSGKTCCMDDIGLPDGAAKKWRQEATEQWNL